MLSELSEAPVASPGGKLTDRRIEVEQVHEAERVRETLSDEGENQQSGDKAMDSV